MKFEPTPKMIALRAYRELYEKAYRAYLGHNHFREAELNAECRGAAQVVLSLGASDADIDRIEEITRIVVDTMEKKDA